MDQDPKRFWLQFNSDEHLKKQRSVEPECTSGQMGVEGAVGGSGKRGEMDESEQSLAGFLTLHLHTI